MNSPLAYIGGKSKLAQTIIDLIPEHKTYCEVFAGAAWVFFRKEPSKFEVINDLDSELVTFYRVLQNHLEEFLKQFKWLLSSREWFEDWKRQQEAGGLTDIQRAARYYYLQRQSYGGRILHRSFACVPNHTPRINFLRLEEELSELYLRLARVIIENLPWSEFVKRYDKPEVFFYLDPPYFQAPYYKHNLALDDYRGMADILADVKAKWIVSINDKPEMRNVFERFHILPVTLNYTVNRNEQTTGKELIVANFDLKGRKDNHAAGNP